MMFFEFVILGIILLISIFLERIFFDINPCLWIVGGIIGVVFGILDIGIVSWLEAIICLILAFILIFFILKQFRHMGGGVKKGLLMCAVFLGRYTFIAYVLFLLILFIGANISERVKKDKIPGENLVCAMPFVAVSVGVTMLVICLFFS